MNEFLQGIILGWGVAVPIGPINVLVMSYALKNYGKALSLGVGAMFADLGFLTLSILGVSQIVHKPIIFNTLAIFGSLFLLYMAYSIAKNAQREIYVQKIEKTENKKWLFIKGFLLNLMNPYVIIFWISVSTTTAKMGNHLILSLIGLFLGIISWMTLFPLVIYKSRTLLKKSTTIALSYISSLILVFFAIMLIYKSFFQAA
ncbi:MAG: LysE family translocator [Neisseriaceae bacterium]|nr:LysE family translocator [Neisseriaceae bacterium]